MKKILLFCLTLCVAISSSAQELPYSKYLNFSKAEFKDNGFRYNDETNTWYLNKISALNTTLNILAIIAHAEEEVRPDSDDYNILVQFGKEDMPSCVRVTYYNDNTYHHLLSFVKTHGQNLIDVTSGKIVKHTAAYGDYTVELKMEQHIISRTSAHTADPHTVKNVDESYNKYEYIIRTGIEPWSKDLEKLAEKQAKREAKGKKKQSVDEMM